MKNAAVHIVCRFLCERKTSAPLSKSQGVRALGHVVTVRFVMQQTAKLLHRGWTILHFASNG